MISFLVIASMTANSQSIDSVLQQYNEQTVPYLKVVDLAVNYNDYVILDTRKKEEYDVSHLPNALWVGEKLEQPIDLDKEKKVLVYCSIGVRSEDFGEQLLELGFTQVYNLYGSIFAWKDAGYQVVDNNNLPTQKVHTYSKSWAAYLKTGEKVYK